MEVILVCLGTSGSKVVTREVAPGAGGVVAMSFGVDDGRPDALLCEPNQDATLTIRGLADGGWYWIHDEANSAVAPLLSNDVLGNLKVSPVNPGSRDISIEQNNAGTASFVKQFSTGRVGILPHVLPEPERRIEPCGPVADGELDDGSPRYVTRETRCTMGDGGTFVGLHTYAATGVALPVRGDRVVRPASGELRVGVALWLNRTGSVVYGATEEFPPTFGWPGIEGAKSLVAEWEVSLLEAGPDATLDSADIDASDLQQSAQDGDPHIVVLPSETHCPAEGEQHVAKVRVRALRTATVAGEPHNPVRPRIRHSEELDGAAAEATLDVVCPAATGAGTAGAQRMGRDLVAPSGLDRR